LRSYKFDFFHYNPCNQWRFCCYHGARWSKTVSFDEKYRLLDLIEDGSPQTFIAEEIATGQKVNVFLFVGEQARTHAELIDQLSTANNTIIPELIETGKNKDTPYVVTQPLGGFAALKMRALQLRISSPPQAGRQHEFSKVGVWRLPQMQQKPSGNLRNEAAGPQSKGQPAAPEFTPTFQAPAAPIGEPAPKPKPPTPEPAPGEFTQLFRSPAAPIGEPAPEPKPSTPEPASGEFTRLFQSAPTASGHSSTSRKPAEQGQFTKIFGGGPVGPAPQESVGQFTGIIQSPSSAAASQPPRPNAPDTSPPAFAPSAGEFTQIFGRPSTGTPISTPSDPQTPVAPGEYTRMFSAQPVISTEESAPAPPAPPLPEPAGPAKQTSKLPLMLAGIVVLLLILIAVLLIAVKK
jgi:hypothetical protein